MLTEKVTCDVCGEERKEANHWFVMLELEGETTKPLPHLRIFRWPAYKDAAQAKHLCGQQCVHSAVDKFLAGRESEVVA